MLLPTSLTGWALDEFMNIEDQFREERDGFSEPTLGRMPKELDQRLMPFQSRAAVRV